MMVFHVGAENLQPLWVATAPGVPLEAEFRITRPGNFKYFCVSSEF